MTTYTLAEVKNGSGFAPGAQFELVIDKPTADDPIVWGLHESHVQDLARMALGRELDADELETFSVGLDNSTVFETVDLILSNLHDESWLR